MLQNCINCVHLLHLAENTDAVKSINDTTASPVTQTTTNVTKGETPSNGTTAVNDPPNATSIKCVIAEFGLHFNLTYTTCKFDIKFHSC